MSAEVEDRRFGFFDYVVEDLVIVVAEYFVEDGLVGGGFEVEVEAGAVKFYFAHMCYSNF